MGIIESALNRVCNMALAVNFESSLAGLKADVDGQEDLLEKLLLIDDEIDVIKVRLVSCRKMLKSLRKAHDNVHIIVSSTEIGGKAYKATNHVENIIDSMVSELCSLNEFYENVRDGNLVTIKTEGFFFKRRVAYLVETS